MLVSMFTRGGLVLFMLVLSFGQSTAAETAHVACENDQSSIEYWRKVRENAAAENANSLALSLAECLRSPNAELRDRIAYEVLTYWMRKDRLDPEQVAALEVRLVPWLATDSDTDDSAISRAFSALVLSEVVRYDALNPFMQEQELAKLHSAATTMFAQERDYRGLTDELGWIHTVAHGADLLWRLSLHPKSTEDQQSKILAVLGSQIVRADIPAYTFNEFDRIARVATAIISRGEVNQDELAHWVVEMADPGELGEWNRAFSSPSGMAQLHNQKHFLRALMYSISDGQPDTIKQTLKEALNSLP